MSGLGLVCRFGVGVRIRVKIVFMNVRIKIKGIWSQFGLLHNDMIKIMIVIILKTKYAPDWLKNKAKAGIFILSFVI